jgi:hypothetical protein
MAGEEIVHELISFLAEYQVGKQPDGTTDVPDDTSFLLVILGAGNIDEDILSNEVMEDLIDNMAKLARASDFDILFGGISEIPSTQSLRGRWWHAWINMLTRKAKELGDRRITYCDIITPSDLTQIHFKEINGKRSTKEPPALVAEKIAHLEQAMKLYLGFHLSHQLLGRQPIVPAVVEGPTETTQSPNPGKDVIMGGE